MNIFLLKSKVHRCVVKQANINYVGSITIDKALMEAAHIYPYEKVQVVNIDNGQRFETYAIGGEENSGIICLNGAAARCVQVGDRIIIMTYCTLNETEIKNHAPIVVLVDGSNQLQDIVSMEIHGDIQREVHGVDFNDNFLLYEGPEFFSLPKDEH